MFMQFKRFLADIAGSLVNTMKRPVGRPSLDAVEPPTKALRVQGNPTQDTRKDGTKNAKDACIARQKLFRKPPYLKG